MLAVGLGVTGFVVYSVFPADNFIESYSPDYSESSDIPLYEGDSSPKIPPYENNAGIIPVKPN